MVKFGRFFFAEYEMLIKVYEFNVINKRGHVKIHLPVGICSNVIHMSMSTDQVNTMVEDYVSSGRVT